MERPAASISAPAAGASDLLAVGFGTTVAMWGVGYVCRLPAVMAPAAVVLVLMLVCLLAGGAVIGRWGNRGWAGGAYAGLVSGVLNLLVLGSLLSSDQPNRLIPSALWWVPGSIVVSALLGAVGAALTSRRGTGRAPAEDWTSALVRVDTVAALFLLGVGGLVTSEGAGLAVVNWPNSFGYNMFLYPLSTMTGGVYYEHAHRLFGSLVGLTTLAMAVHLWRADRRRWVRWTGVGALALVVIQGIVGGLRVTGRFTLSTSLNDVAPNIHLAVLHAVLGQVFFGTLVALSVVTSRRWKGEGIALPPRGEHRDRGLADTVVVLLLLQLVLGAVQRHLAAGLRIHIAMAMVILALAVVLGARVWGHHRDAGMFASLGKLLIVLTSVQVLLGFGAYVATVSAPGGELFSRTYEVTVATAHQWFGALLLACTVILTLWLHRVERGS